MHVGYREESGRKNGKVDEAIALLIKLDITAMMLLRYMILMLKLIEKLRITIMKFSFLMKELCVKHGTMLVL